MAEVQLTIFSVNLLYLNEIHMLFTNRLFFLFFLNVILPLSEQALPDPLWPADFLWSSSGGDISGYDCIQIDESVTGFDNNYFCWDNTKANPGLKWFYRKDAPYYAALDANMRCTGIFHDAHSYTRSDNYLCVPSDSTLNFEWSTNGEITGLDCIEWSESEWDKWNETENFLCAVSNTQT